MCLHADLQISSRSSLTSDALLLQTINELKELTLNLFFSGLNASVQKLVEKVKLAVEELIKDFIPLEM